MSLDSDNITNDEYELLIEATDNDKPPLTGGAFTNGRHIVNFDASIHANAEWCTLVRLVTDIR